MRKSTQDVSSISILYLFGQGFSFHSWILPTRDHTFYQSSITLATANKSLRLTVRASDDYGLREFAIIYRVNGEENQRRISLGAPPSNDSQKDLGAPRSGTWPLQWNIPDDLPNLRGGDFIEVAIEVTEVAGDPSKARKAVTRTCGIEILSLADYQAYVTSRFETLQNDLAETERRETLIRHAIESSIRQSQNSQK